VRTSVHLVCPGFCVVIPRLAREGDARILRVGKWKKPRWHPEFSCVVIPLYGFMRGWLYGQSFNAE